MKLSIIGGGNMGSAIARGLVKGTFFQANDITVVDIQQKPLDKLKSLLPEIRTELCNYDSLSQADIIVLAVKPWMIEDTIVDIKFKLDYSRQIVASIAARIDFELMSKAFNKTNDIQSVPTLFRIIPNTAIAVGQSMTLIASKNATKAQSDLLLNIFNEMGKAVMVEEHQLAAGTALTSCGIAYLFRYVRAAMEAGVEMGFYPQQAQDLIVNTMKGAAELLLQNGEHPEVEIDKVTTPGGITIKGLNELEKQGFTNAVIQAMRVSR